MLDNFFTDDEETYSSRGMVFYGKILKILWMKHVSNKEDLSLSTLKAKIVTVEFSSFAFCRCILLP